MEIEHMTLAELLELSEAIKAEARKRENIIQDILHAGKKRYVTGSAHGNYGAAVGVVRYPLELFRQAADEGLTVTEASERIGCHYTKTYAVQKEHGIKFKPGIRGPKKVSE